MGKRKERRLAALSAAGRRVKLDLFAEPSGDLGGSSVHDEVGGDLNPNNRAGVTHSPSTSGQHQENPLLLLGQYSDDELNDAATESSLIDHNGQVEEPVGTECGDLIGNAGEEIPAKQDKEDDMENNSALLDVAIRPEDTDTRETDVTASGDPCNQIDSGAQVSDAGTSGIQVLGDVSSGWKMVMHEESNRYYYWNTETGETSWEVPDVLAQGAEMASGQKVLPVTQEGESSHVDTDASNPKLAQLNMVSNDSTIDGSNGSNLILDTKEKYEFGLQMDKQNEGYNSEHHYDLNLGAKVNQTESKDSSGTVTALCQEMPSLHDYVSTEQSNIALSSAGGLTSTVCEDNDKNLIIVNEQHEAGIALSSHLVKYGENLLQQLKALEGYEDHPQGHDWLSKYIFEVEIRLSDFKSLLAYGSSLLPFWLHSEGQLKRIECTINDEVSRISKSQQLKEVEAGHISPCSAGNTSSENMEEESDLDEKEQVVVSSENFHTSPNVNTLKAVQKEVHDRSTEVDLGNARDTFLTESPTQCLGSEAEGSVQKVNEVEPPDVLMPKAGPNAGEDIDMDVDMEVDDETPANRTSGDSLNSKYFTPSEQQIQPNALSLGCPLAPEDDIIAQPPPDEEWIPPPPPDNEPVPPPPPDDPLPSDPPPPPYAETAQPHTYTEQYNMTYPIAHFDYYGTTITEVPSANYYAHSEGCQLAEPQPVLYYETVLNTYPEAAPVVVNTVPVESVVYYDLSNGMIPPGPVISIGESSGFYTESGPVSYHDSAASVQMASVEVVAESGSSSVPSMMIGPDVSATRSEAEMVTIQVPPDSATATIIPHISSTATMVINESAPAASGTVPSAAPLTTASKAQSKVLRGKKRTVAVAPTLRSNKKVSSLVDKWKAAKEELHEDEEDEPENAYEMLEKKRQKDIEEWRAQQIASGEAKNNANFQPLGGDWRERVKRKRAQSTKEAVQTPSEAPVKEKQQPDLIELARDLPSGWQAFWDESSKEVYYGNMVTMETTWTRPTS